MKRITLVACFDDKSNKKIDEIVANYKENLCKVPYNVEDRSTNDTLPYHITLSAWNDDKTKYILSKIKNISFKAIKCTYKFNLMDSTIKGNIMYLDLLDDSNVKELQKIAFNLLPTEKYNPSTFKLHLTININENKKFNINLLNKLRTEKLSLTIDKICLFEIYPAKLLYTIDLL